jgi:hypothetical protein
MWNEIFLYPWLNILQVVLAANNMPTINDITYEELVQVVSKVPFPIIPFLMLVLGVRSDNTL